MKIHIISFVLGHMSPNKSKLYMMSACIFFVCVNCEFNVENIILKIGHIYLYTYVCVYIVVKYDTDMALVC